MAGDAEVKAVTADEMRTIEGACVARGITLDSLMAQAGEAVARSVTAHRPDGPVLILVGPGNNGGDGLVAAASLSASGRDVVAYTWHRRDVSPFAGAVVTAEDDESGDQLRRLVRDRAVLVDALLGIGQSRLVEGQLGGIVDMANTGRAPDSWALAVDIPTGVDADSGARLGSAFRADVTLCMGLSKLGAFLYPGAEFAGEVRVADVGIPGDLDADISTTVSDAREIASLLPRRDPEANKGSSGRVLVVSGSRDFTGAPVLASTAAYRAGAGLVEIATPECIQLTVAAHVVEAIFRPLPYADGMVDPAAIEQIEEGLGKARSLVLGPGLGLSDGTTRVVREVLTLLGKPKSPPAVIDADALNALARIDGWHEGLGDVVVTPHPGEMSRLTGLSIPEIQSDRLSVARRFAAMWGVTVVLKGARTVVASPDGSLAINPTGGPNLATAGTGDVLSGVIGGLLAQGCGPREAARAGVFLHGRAGDLARDRLGEAGTVAGDLLSLIPVARQSVLQSQEEVA